MEQCMHVARLKQVSIHLCVIVLPLFPLQILASEVLWDESRKEVLPLAVFNFSFLISKQVDVNPDNTLTIAF